MASKELKPHVPGRGVHIHLDLEDFTRKAVQYGPAHVLGETIMNLCLMANDHITALKNGGVVPKLEAGKPHKGGKKR